MSLLTKLGQGQGYLKAGFLGFPKAGKTYTATTLAIGTRALMEQTGPIAMFDTEGGSEYIAERIRRETKTELQGVKSQSFSDLIAVGKECEKEGISVLIVDSITHVWRELCDAYLAKVNEGRLRKNMGKRFSLEFQDWGIIKRQWASWTDFYLNSKLHIIICGRAGFEYDYEKNEETGKKELMKTGVKMKTESEFGFEPSLLVQMDRDQVQHNGSWKTQHEAIVIGDRFGVIDGKSCIDPGFEFFLPHIRLLKPGSHTVIDTDLKSAENIDLHGDDDHARRKRERTIILEEIEGEMVKRWPGQTKDEKLAKLETIEKVFETKSWEKVVKLISLEDLKAGLAKIREIQVAREPGAEG